MDMTPAVSVIIPTYNHEKFLQKCLQSLLGQTFASWEAYVINNFSEDNTIEVVNSFHDSRIHLVNFKNNGIIAASRNHGIKLSHAGLIAFLDSDDIWYPTKLSRCIQELSNNRDLVCHNLRYVKNGKYWKDVKCGPLEKAGFNELLYKGSCLTTSAVVVRKECLSHVSGFSEDPEIVTSEDYDLWLKLSRSGARFHFIDEILGEYRVHESNASNSVYRHMNSALTVIEKNFASTGKNGKWEHLKLKRAKALQFYGAARSFQLNNKRAEALRCYWKCILIFPFLLKCYAGIILTLTNTK